jgi:uncharacterized protein
LTHDSLKVFVRDQSYNRHLQYPRILNWTDLNEILKKELE